VQHGPAADGKASYGLAALDLSVGSLMLGEAPEANLAAEIARLEPSEIVAPEALLREGALARIVAESGIAATKIAEAAADPALAARRVAEFYGVASLDGFGAFTDGEIAAAALVFDYLKRTQFAATPDIAPPKRRALGEHLEIDAATRANLELTRTLSGERPGSLLHCLDATATGAGARLLAERLASPLASPGAINARLDAVGALIEARAVRRALRAHLKAVPDFARGLGRLALDRGGPRDLQALAVALAEGAAIGALLAEQTEWPATIARLADNLSRAPAGLQAALEATLADELPLSRRDGGFVREGARAELDEARALRDESRRVIAEMQARYAGDTAIRALKIKHNSFLGYFIEVPAAAGEALLKAPLAGQFVHRQTMADAMRFSTLELGELERKIASAADRALKLELEAFEALRQAALAESKTLRDLADALAELDVIAGLAELAQQRDWTRPKVDGSLAFAIRGGRHPVVEAALQANGRPFVANDCDLSGSAEGGRLALVTGPNMAGKSTYLRQNAIIALMAQMGSFVPANAAEIGVLDRLFSRVGAADDLARGRSTFMVEMVETAAILNQATERSLVILDEIGRGTATFDGLSIAHACVEHLNAANRSRALFATHFHELTPLAETLPRVFNLTMRVREWKGDLVFLHEVAPGAADRSYGVQVAKLAGLPASVVKRARGLLTQLEAGKPASTSLEALPLFASAAPDPAKPDLLREGLEALDPDTMAPRDALEALYELKRLAKESHR
jgi:DNA mismatch repair protein MutS